MLVLSRKEGESIVLTTSTGETVTITLTKYRGVQTIVGIEAPKNVKILRTELQNRHDSDACHTHLNI